MVKAIAMGGSRTVKPEGWVREDEFGISTGGGGTAIITPIDTII